ncbi:family 10 glycosylhydrolase [Synechocystis sp. PCC 7509]|uniref:family 10 glycosylhydrolase n=1 Tax=Synechocystis sp. PCC 7509 TaxID=927677 RepID=UPI0002ABE9C9|nr:family 10 glycosylhydrolase [Synechocystis sp. PCC 7509]
MVDLEVRGVWLTLDDSNVLKSETNIREALTKLKSHGFNTIYPAVWHSGHTLYHSQVAENFMGVAVKPDKDFEDRKLMEELVKVSKEQDFRLIPWFEFGLMVPPNSPIDKLEDKDPSKFKDLITRTKDGGKIRIKEDDLGQLMRDDSGKLVPDDFVWMNPCHPEVQNFMVELIGVKVAKS